MNGPATFAPAELDDLSGLVASRLCHDLVSPLGAIGNGVELLEMSGEFPGIARSAELGLVSDSIAAARGRIRVARVAFGGAEATQRLSMAELAALVSDASAGGRVRARLDAQGDLPRTEARMILLALMCLDSILAWGGTVLIARGAVGWRLVATAERLRVRPELWAQLDAGAPPPAGAVAAADVQFPLLRMRALAEGRPLQAEYDDSGAEIAF